MLKNIQKNFSGSHPTGFRSSRRPLDTLCNYLKINQLRTQSVRYESETDPKPANPAKRGTSWNILQKGFKLT